MGFDLKRGFSMKLRRKRDGGIYRYGEAAENVEGDEPLSGSCGARFGWIFVLRRRLMIGRWWMERENLFFYCCYDGISVRLQKRDLIFSNRDRGSHFSRLRRLTEGISAVWVLFILVSSYALCHVSIAKWLMLWVPTGSSIFLISICIDPRLNWKK